MLRFSIRELLLVTLIAAMCLAWWADRRYYSQLPEKTELVRWKIDAMYEMLVFEKYTIRADKQDYLFIVGKNGSEMEATPTKMRLYAGR